jgi:hypothetical protein
VISRREENLLSCFSRNCRPVGQFPQRSKVGVGVGFGDHRHGYASVENTVAIRSAPITFALL